MLDQTQGSSNQAQLLSGKKNRIHFMIDNNIKLHDLP